MTSTNPDAARITEFVHSIEDRCSVVREPWSLGTTLFHPEYPIRYSINFLRLERYDPAVASEQIAEEAEEIHRRAGHAHRKIIVDDAVIGSRLANGFRKLDWSATRLVWMTLQAEPPPPGPVEVIETDLEGIRDAWITYDVEEQNTAREEAEMLAESMRVVVEATGMRIFAGLVDGKIAGWCELYSDDGIGQVENVSTYKWAQGRGVARSVIARAVKESISSGSGLDFLIADDDDWPKELYARLGYQPVSYTYEFMKKPT